MVAEVLNVLLGLVAVVAAIFATAWLLRRSGVRAAAGTTDLRVLGGVAVGQRERVVLLECRGQQLLVGVAQGSVRALHVLGDAPAGADARAFDGVLAEARAGGGLA